MRAWPGRWRLLARGAFSLRARLCAKLLPAARLVCPAFRRACLAVHPVFPALLRGRLAYRQVWPVLRQPSIASPRYGFEFRRFFPGCGLDRLACRRRPAFSDPPEASRVRRWGPEFSHALFPSARPTLLVSRRALPAARPRLPAACLMLPVGGQAPALARRNQWPA